MMILIKIKSNQFKPLNFSNKIIFKNIIDKLNYNFYFKCVIIFESSSEQETIDIKIFKE